MVLFSSFFGDGLCTVLPRFSLYIVFFLVLRGLWERLSPTVTFTLMPQTLISSGIRESTSLFFACGAPNPWIQWQCKNPWCSAHTRPSDGNSCDRCCKPHQILLHKTDRFRSSHPESGTASRCSPCISGWRPALPWAGRFCNRWR